MWRVTVHYREDEWEKLKEQLDQSGYPWYRGGEKSIVVYVPDEDVEDFITKLEETLDMRYKENLIEADRPHIVSSGPAKRILYQKTPSTLATVDEIVSRAREYASKDPWKILLTVLAALITFTGLWMDNPTIIIGAMLLSPLLSPLYAFSVSAIAGDRKMVRDSIANLILLFSTTYTSILAASLILKSLGYIPPMTREIALRTETNVLYIPVAILLGSASMIAIRREVTEAIAGIAIAAALLPPLTVSALLAPFSHCDSMNALIVTLDNIVGLTMGAVVALAALRIKPRRKRINSYRLFVILVLLFMLLAVLLLISWS